MNLSAILANYKLDGRTVFQGLPISIENAKGSTRSGTGKDGKAWKVRMSFPYGYIRMSEGVDGDHVDCFLGPNVQAKNAYVIHTTEPSTGGYDEDKVMLGWDDPGSAKKAFLENYSSAKFFGSMDTIPMDKFKEKVLATRQTPQKITAKSRLETTLALHGTAPASLSIGDQVAVDGLRGRAVVVGVGSGKVTVRYRDGQELTRSLNFVHPISGRLMDAGGPGSGCRGDNCGRPSTGKSLILGDSVPPKDKPVVLVFGGSFNPPHQGHADSARRAAELLKKDGYKVDKIVIAPTADRLLKAKLGARMYPLSERTALSKKTFPADMEVTSKPAEEAEQFEGKLRRTQLADYVIGQYPGRTVINVTGEDAAPGHPPGYPSLYEGDGNHKGYYYLAIDRPADSLSSSQIRRALHDGTEVPGMTPEAESHLRNYLKQHPDIKLVASGTPEGAKKAWDTRGRGRALKEQQHRIAATLQKINGDPTARKAEALAKTMGDHRQTSGILDKDGYYKPEADAENRKIAESFINPNSKPAPGQLPVAVFIIGKPGSGKTFMIKTMGKEFPTTTMINSDDIKEKIPGYSPDQAAAYHERSCDIARQYLTQSVVGQGLNVTFDMTDNSSRLTKTMEMLKERGYKIGLLLAHVDSATSIERVYERFKRTGRYVPPKVVLSYGDKPERSYEEAKKIAHDYRAYDTRQRDITVIDENEGGSVFKRAQRRVGASVGRRSGVSIKAKEIKAGGPGSGCRGDNCGRPRTAGPRLRPGQVHSYRAGSVIYNMYNVLSDGQSHSIRSLNKQFGEAAVTMRLRTLALHGQQTGNWALERGRVTVTLVRTTPGSTTPSWQQTRSFMDRSVAHPTDAEKRRSEAAERIREANARLYDAPARPTSLRGVPFPDNAPVGTTFTPAEPVTRSANGRKPEGSLSKPLKEDAHPSAGVRVTPPNAINDFRAKFSMNPEDYRDAMLKGVSNRLRTSASVVMQKEGTNSWRIMLNASGVEQTRVFDFADNSVYHSYWNIDPDLQSKGIGKTVFDNQLDIYDHLGMKTIGVGANISVGGYAWARYGFVPTQEDWASIRRNAQTRLNNSTVTPDVKARVKLVLSMSDPKAIWLLASMKDQIAFGPRGKQDVGKALLLGTSWHGDINLDDREQYAVVRSYTGSNKKKDIKSAADSAEPFALVNGKKIDAPFHNNMLSSKDGQDASDLLAINYAMPQGWKFAKAVKYFASPSLKGELIGGADVKAASDDMRDLFRKKWKEIEADKEGEPMVGNMARNKDRPKKDWFEPKSGTKGGIDDVEGVGEHIDPIPTFHPPSLRNKQRVPSDSPGETDDRFLDVTKRKQAHDQQMKMLRRSAPSGLMPARTTAPSVYGARDKSRPARRGKGMRVMLPRDKD